jgi:NitT/TauT family transport system substrate-binding protein
MSTRLGVRRTLMALAVALLALALGVGACGDDEDSGSDSAASGSGSSSDGGGLDKVKIALYPSTDYPALYLGQSEGIFEKHGVELEIEQVTDPQAIVAAINSGSTDLGSTSVSGASTAVITGGLDLKVVAPADLMPKEGYVEIVTRADSGIDSLKDLEGKTVATITLNGLFDLAMRTAVEAEGGDVSTIKSLAMPPTDEPQALKAGRVDAIVIQDPFLVNMMKDKTFKSLGNPFSHFDYSVPGSAYYSAGKTVEEKGDVLRRFREAHTEATAKLREDPDQARAIFPEYTQLTPDVANAIGLPDYDASLPADGVQKMLEGMKKYGFLKEDIPPFEELVWEPEGVEH